MKGTGRQILKWKTNIAFIDRQHNGVLRKTKRFSRQINKLKRKVGKG